MPNVGRGAGSAARGTWRGWSPARGLGARLAVIVAVAGVIGLWAGPARAAVLVLGVHEDGQPRARARAVVAQHLSRMGEAAREPSLPSEELACTESACLARLARAHRAERIVGGELLPNDRTYLVRMWLYDTVAQQPASTEDRCIECSAEQAYELAARLAGRLLDAAAAAPEPNQAPPPRTEPLHAPLATPPVAVQPAAATSTSGRCARRVYTFGRGVAVGALGALTAAGLATAIGLHAADGSVYLPAGDYGDGFNLPADVEHRFGANYRLAYGLTAVTALGLTAALLPWHKILPREGGARPVQCPTTRSKWTFNRGLLVGSLGSLLIGGLVTAAATHALDGGTYPLGDINVPYRFQSVYTAGYVLSGGLALGLGVSLLWP